MSASGLLSVSDCASLVHVTEDTIREYARLGFLTPNGEGEEMRFMEKELRAIFGVELIETPAEPVAVESVSPTQDVATSEESDPARSFLREQIEVAQQPQSTNTPGDDVEPFVQRFHRMRGELSTPTPSTDGEDAWGTYEIRGRSDRENVFRDERVLSLLNSQLSEELKMLREERDWLRQRLEKLEARSERDQMLLLSESENVRGLVDMHQRRKPFWLRALPWLAAEEKKIS